MRKKITANGQQAYPDRIDSSQYRPYTTDITTPIQYTVVLTVTLIMSMAVKNDPIHCQTDFAHIDSEYYSYVAKHEKRWNPIMFPV